MTAGSSCLDLFTESLLLKFVTQVTVSTYTHTHTHTHVDTYTRGHIHRHTHVDMIKCSECTNNWIIIDELSSLFTISYNHPLHHTTTVYNVVI